MKLQGLTAWAWDIQAWAWETVPGHGESMPGHGKSMPGHGKSTPGYVAIHARDLTFQGTAKAGQPVVGQLVVHNIGAHDGRDIERADG